MDIVLPVPGCPYNSMLAYKPPSVPVDFRFIAMIIILVISALSASPFVRELNYTIKLYIVNI